MCRSVVSLILTTTPWIWHYHHPILQLGTLRLEVKITGSEPTQPDPEPIPLSLLRKVATHFCHGAPTEALLPAPLLVETWCPPAWKDGWKVLSAILSLTFAMSLASLVSEMSECRHVRLSGEHIPCRTWSFLHCLESFA